MSDLEDLYGSAHHPDRVVARVRPEGSTDEVVAAVGQVSAALEIVEQARGLLYAFHRESGRADLALQDAVQALDDAGHVDLAAEIRTVLVGRDVIPGKWSFEMVEDYDDSYWQVFRAVEAKVRATLSDGARHVYEAELKQHEQR